MKKNDRTIQVVIDKGAYLLAGAQRITFHVLKVMQGIKEKKTILIGNPPYLQQLRKVLGISLHGQYNIVNLPFKKEYILPIMRLPQRSCLATLNTKILEHILQPTFAFFATESTLNYIAPFKDSKNVIYIHGPSVFKTYTGKNIIKKKYSNFFINRITKSLIEFDKILCNSFYTLKRINYYLDNKKVIDVIYPPVDVEFFKCNNSFANREDKVISIGRFVRSKNFEIVLEVAKLLPDVQFKICGIINKNYPNEVRYYKELSKNKPHNVQIIANANIQLLKKELHSSKIYLHAEKYEDFGISVVEAMAAGCVPIVYKTGGPAYEIIENKKSGFTWEELKDIREIILLLLTNETLWEKMSRNSLARAMKFDKDIFENKIYDLIVKFGT